jgi:putative ABC transport system permease protein
LINVVGLAIGMASFLFISKYVALERQVDHFHEYFPHIYRLHTDLKWNDLDESFPETAPAVGTAIADNYAEVEYVTRILPYHSEHLVKIKNDIFKENSIMAVDSNFLKVFSFEIVSGNKDRLFTHPDELVLSQSYARKYFADQDPLGKILDIEGDLYKVAGIIEDAPASSHIQYDILVSNLSSEDLAYFEWSWVWCNLVTYVRLNPNASPNVLESKFPELVRNNAGNAIERLTGKPFDDFFERGNNLGYLLEPLSEVYYSNYNPLGGSSKRTFMYIFSAVAFIILLLACINYTNLTTARAIKRAKEIGLRKVVGTSKRQLHLQFLVESVLFSFIAMMLAIFFYETISMWIARHFDFPWNLSIFSNPEYLLYIIGLTIIVGIFSGLYPAFYLSSFNVATSLKGLQAKGSAKSPLRNVLLVIQFIISFCIIIFTFSVNEQISFLRNRDLGFDKENLIVINNVNQLPSRDVFKAQVNQNPAVISSTLSSHVPSLNAHGELFRKLEGEQEDFLARLIDADMDYLKTFGLKMIEGQNFTSSDLQSNSPKIVINQEAIKTMVFDDPMGRRIMGLDDGRELEIGGVIRDFDYFLSQVEMNPIIIRPYIDRGPENLIKHLTVKVASQDLQNTIAQLNKIWESQHTGIPFEYQFYNEIFDDIYNKEIRLGNLLSIFSGLAITIALLGLIGLISFHTEQLTKSIGIRKVFGATIPNILGLITKDFAKLLLIAFVIAVPVSNYAIEDWLESFLYRINIDPWLFIIPGVLVIAIALLTIWIQSYKSATANPVDAIRNE